MGNFSVCFLLLKFIIDFVVIVVRGPEVRKSSGATFGFVRPMIDATFHFFVLSLRTPISETDENKIVGNLGVQNVTGKETLAAPTYEENPTSLYPHVHIVNNPLSISSNITESQGNDFIVFHSSGNVPLNSNVSTHGNTPSTSSTLLNNSIHGNSPSTLTVFLNNSFQGNATSTSNNGNVPNSSGNAPLRPP